jgi:hypothetical protein
MRNNVGLRERLQAAGFRLLASGFWFFLIMSNNMRFQREATGCRLQAFSDNEQ